MVHEISQRRHPEATDPAVSGCNWFDFSLIDSAWRALKMSEKAHDLVFFPLGGGWKNKNIELVFF